MNGRPAIRVVPLAGRTGLAHRRFGPDDTYVEAVWLPVLGPASFVVWHRLARQAASTSETETSLEELAAAAGIGSARGTQSGIARALRRLERFGLLRRCGDDLLVVRCRLPFISDHQLERLHPSVRAAHRAFHERAQDDRDATLVSRRRA